MSTDRDPDLDPQDPQHTPESSQSSEEPQGAEAEGRSPRRLLGGTRPRASRRPAGRDRDELDDLGPEELLERSGARHRRRTKARRTTLPEHAGRKHYTPRQRLLILDTWLRSKLPAGEFAGMVGVSQHTLYAWKARFEKEGPAGLEERKPGRAPGTRLPEPTKRAILMLKAANPDWGQERIRDVLRRSEGFDASPGAIGRVLKEEGYVVELEPTKPHPDKPRRFERAHPNDLWQTDLFTFTLKREGRRVHLVGFMDDTSRFITGYALSGSSSGVLVRDCFLDAIANFGAPNELLTDNGPQYVSWQGKSAFQKLCEKKGVQQIVAKPRRPQTLGKIERFWGTLWRECVEQAVFRGLDDARARIGHFIDHYNFQRTHTGIDGLVPADRFFAASGEVRRMLGERIAENALELARNGMPRKPFYLTGRVGDQTISLHAEGERVVMTKEDGSREEVDLGAVGKRAEEGEADELPQPLAQSSVPFTHPALEAAEEEPAPGASPLDAALRALADGLSDPEGEDDDEEDDDDDGGLRRDDGSGGGGSGGGHGYETAEADEPDEPAVQIGADS